MTADVAIMTVLWFPVSARPLGVRSWPDGYLQYSADACPECCHEVMDRPRLVFPVSISRTASGRASLSFHDLDARLYSAGCEAFCDAGGVVRLSVAAPDLLSLPQ